MVDQLMLDCCVCEQPMDFLETVLESGEYKSIFTCNKEDGRVAFNYIIWEVDDVFETEATAAVDRIADDRAMEHVINLNGG